MHDALCHIQQILQVRYKNENSNEWLNNTRQKYKTEVALSYKESQTE